MWGGSKEILLAYKSDLSNNSQKALWATSLTLLAIFSFYDLQISQAINQPESGFGNFLADFGLILGHILIICAAIIYSFQNTKNAKIFATLILLFEAYLVNVDYGAVGGTATIILSFLIAKFFFLANPQLTHPKIKTGAKYLCISALVYPFIFVHSLKAVWGRIRFRNLSTDFSEFSRWFEPQGVTGGHSFPSGHTAMGVMACYVILLLPKKYHTTALLLTVPWALAVGASRMIIGAHYASDVTFSLLIGFSILLFLNRKLNETV
jgi:membrane-associated phospholipid phosphatase